MHKKAIIKSAIILTSANIITRVLGFFYRIYMSKTIGAEGMGLYQIITPLYLLIWAISSSGLSTTMSKLTAQEKAKGQQGNAEKILTISLIISVAIALCLSISVHNFAEEISQYIIKDKRTTLSLKWLSPCFPFMAAGSVIRGYFLGMQEAKVPAISQVIEQIVRMLAVYVLADTFVPMGLEYACGAAILGMALGEIISFLFTALNLFFVNHKLKPKVPTITTFTALSLITSMAIPLTLNRVASSIYATVENIILPQRLQLFGMSQSQALSELGRLSGMAMPLVMFPSSLLTALATAILPVIAECYTLKNYNRITSTLKHSLLLTAIVACGTGGLFITYGYEIGQLIYSEKEIGSMLKLIGFICPFTYLQVTLSGVLNGLKVQAEKQGYDITFINTCFENRKMSYLEHCKYRNFEGVAIVCADFNDPGVMELMNSEVPVVTIDYLHHSCTAVSSNNIQGMEDLVRYIYSQGHRRIAYIHGQQNGSAVTKDRLTSFYRTMDELKLEVPDEYIRTADYLETREAAKQTKELLNLENPPTCIIYPDDTALIGGRNVIIEMGLRIPKDISVAGYDGTRMSQLLHPKLTTIKQDTEEIGREAAKRLIGSIEKPKTTLLERVVIEGILIPGQSVGKIPEQK